MKRYFLAVGMLLSASVMAQTTQIYKWTDSNGNVHFTDKPHPGAEEVQLPPVQTFSEPVKPTPPPASLAEGSARSTEAQVSHYDKFSISQPADQETIRNAQGYISVILDIKPKLMAGDKVQMIFDGSPVGEPQPTPVIELQEVNRGSHTLAAQIVNAKGEVLTKTNMITIYMMPPRVGMGQ